MGRRAHHRSWVACITSTLLTLVVISVIYSLLGGLRRATGGVGTALPAAGRAPSPRAGNLTPERVALTCKHSLWV